MIIPRSQRYAISRFNFYLQALNYNKDTVKSNSKFNPPVNPYDLNHHRGKRTLKAGDEGASKNAFQERMAKTIQDYTKGNLNVNAFRSQLQEYNVPIDSNMDKLIRKHESGDFQSYNEFGKHIFR